MTFAMKYIAKLNVRALKQYKIHMYRIEGQPSKIGSKLGP